MKEVNVYVRGNAYPVGEDTEGQYISIVEVDGESKEVYGIGTGKITTNRMIIRGLTESLKLLEEPCKVNLHTHTQIGLLYLKSKRGNETDGVRKCVNRDLLLLLKKEMIKGKHKIVEKIGREKQDVLAERLEDYRE